MCKKCQVSIYHSKRDIDVKKIKVEYAFFVYSATSQVYGSLLSIQKCLMQSNTMSSSMAILFQREYCKLTPHDCCLSLINVIIQM